MSMTVQIAMQGITDLEILITALQAMGIKALVSSDKQEKRISNILACADIHGQRVQFRRHKNGHIDMVGDSDWRIFKDEKFRQKLKQQYSLETVKKKVVELRYRIASVKQLEDGAIKLVARAWR
jgi:hypothetical protein